MEIVREYSNSNVMEFDSICVELTALYEEKNRRYGDSFSKQVEKRGLLVPLIRLEDKLRRLDTLICNPFDDGGDESIEDTLKDLANYSIMTLMAIRKRGKESACTVSEL